jgi:5-formyltetrahydrofolate cyclo-ligase
MPIDKEQIRQTVWDRMEREGIECFPGARGRIPNFGGAAAAADRLAGTKAWRLARALKCNPDAPQRPVRLRALQAGKTVFMAVPRLRELRCFVKLDPARIPRTKWRDAASIAGSLRYGVLVHPRDMPGIDLVIAGSVAVNPHGERIGKGGGYSDLEWALGREFGFLKAATPVATTVHPVQVLERKLPVLAHDVTVDLIVTAEKVIPVKPRPPKPRGIDRRRVTAEMSAAIPILREALGKRAFEIR